MSLTQWQDSWDRGIQDFNAHRYWHAHEAWETNWLKLPEPDRSHIKALIQFCGVCVHIEKKRWSPALRLAHRSLELFAEASAHQKLLKKEPELKVKGLEDVLIKITVHLMMKAHDVDFLLSLAKTLKA